MRVKGDGIFSINTSPTSSFGSDGVSLPEPIVDEGGGGGGDFTPISTDLLFFLDAQTGIYTDAGTTEATDGQAIQQINDQSTAGITATNTNVGYQATYEAPSINGLNSIRLQISNALDTYFLSSNVNVTDLFTIHWVYKKDALDDRAVIMVAGTQLLSDESAYTYLLQASAWNGGNSQGNEWSIATFILRKGDPTQSPSFNGEFLINGVSLGKFSSNAPATQAIDRLFNRVQARTGEYNVGDVLVYGAVQNLADVGFTQNGLNSKYGELYLPIDTSLPSPPTISGTTLEWYHNPDYNTYSDIGTTLATNLDYIRSAKVTTGDFSSMVQNTASEQMQYKTSVLPNSKASYYKGGKDYMQMNEAKVFTSSESFVAYSVHKRTDINGTNAIFGKEADYDNTIMDWNSGYAYYKENSGQAFVTGLTNTTNTVVRAYVIDRTAQLFRVYENGVEQGTADTTSITADTTFDLMFNRWVNGTGTIDHGITLLYRGLHSATDVGTVSDWLNAYYGDLIY
jgi:hypothetical protein